MREEMFEGIWRTQLQEVSPPHPNLILHLIVESTKAMLLDTFATLSLHQRKAVVPNCAPRPAF